MRPGAEPALPAGTPDAALLRRAAAGLARRPGEHGDLFLESVVTAEVALDERGPRLPIVGLGSGTAARVIADGATRHLAHGGLDPEMILALPARLRSEAPPDERGMAAQSPADRAKAAQSPADRAAAPRPTAAGIDAPPEEGGGCPEVAMLAAYLEEIAACLRAAAPIRAFEARAGWRRQRMAVATSEGECAEETRGWAWFTLRAVSSGRGGTPIRAASGGGARDAARLRVVHPPAQVAARLARSIDEAGHSAPAPSGEVPVVLAPGVGGLLFHEACGHALEGDRALRGRSALAGLLGERVGPEILTLVDDPTLDGLAGSRRHDDEGWPAAPTVLIDAGRVSAILLDRSTARLAGSAPTGSARRESYRDLPLPRMTNTFVRPGTASPEEVLREAARGLYIAELGPGWADTATGDFEFRVRRGYLVAGGRIVAPSGACVVSGNGVRALAGVRRVGVDLEFDPGSGECGKEGQRARAAVGQPTVLVEGLSVRPVGA